MQKKIQECIKNDKNTLSQVKDTTTLKVSPNGFKASKHPLVDHKPPRKLPSEFRSSIESLVKYNIKEGLPHRSKAPR